MKRLMKNDIYLLKEILNTPYETLLNEIRDEDYKEKKLLIEQIDFYKQLYEQTDFIIAKDIAQELIAELEQVNEYIAEID